MPKRPNPFGDCAPLQLKTHVGIKELAAGIRQEELMKSVYGEWSRIRGVWTKPKMEITPSSYFCYRFGQLSDAK